MKKIIFTLTFILISVLMFGQSVTMTINGAYADSSGNARNSKKLQGKDTAQLLAYTKALVSSLGMPTCVQGDLLYGSGTNTYAKLAKNTTATRYLSNTGTSNNPVWAQINLANGVTGSLGSNHGGTVWGSNSTDPANIYYSGGRVSIGDNTNPVNSQLRVKMDVNSSTIFPVTIENSINNTSANGLKIIFGYNTDYAGPKGILFLRPDLTELGSITQDDGVLGTLAFNVTSDSILKHNIKDSKLNLTTLMSIKVREFNWKRDKSNKTCTGFVAQELYKVYPSAVYKPKDSKSNWQVNYQGLIPLIVKSIQDQQAEISDLTKRIEALEKR